MSDATAKRTGSNVGHDLLVCGHTTSRPPRLCEEHRRVHEAAAWYHAGGRLGQVAPMPGTERRVPDAAGASDTGAAKRMHRGGTVVRVGRIEEP